MVWKTLGSQVKNVSSRYSSVDFNGGKVMGFNNIELISDRPLDINLAEIKEGETIKIHGVKYKLVKGEFVSAASLSL